MPTFIKYLLPIIVIILSIFGYFRYTESGHKNAYTIMSLYAGYKAGLDVDIKDINTNQFPYITIDTIIEDKYKVSFDGFVTSDGIDLRYTLHSSCFKSNICTFDDTIDIKGKLHIAKRHLDVEGAGRMFDGNVTYTFVKDKKVFKDVVLEIKDVNSTKLLKLLKQKAIFKGQAYARLEFDTISKKHKRGKIHYSVKDPQFYGQAIDYIADITVEDNTHTFTMNLSSDDMNLSLNNGHYNQEQKYGTAIYTLDVPDVSKIKKLLKGSFKGAFHATGEMVYDKKIHIKGVSNNLGGELKFDYDSRRLKVDLKNLSFSKIMHALATKPVLDANLTGHGIYTFKTKQMHLKTNLLNARLIPSSTITDLEKEFSIPLLAQTYDKSSLELTLNDGILSSNFTLANEKMSLSLKDTKLNAQRTAINTQIELKVPKHSLKGKLYARMDSMGERDLDEYYIKYNGTVEKYYHLSLDGMLSKSFINMDYHIDAARLPSSIVTIVDDINLSGHISGAFKRLHLVGTGEAMEGKLTYSGVKVAKHLESVEIRADNIHALKLFTLLGLPNFPNGKADINASLSYIDKHKQEGTLIYRLKKGSYQKLPLSLLANVQIDAQNIHFVSIATLANADINITKGIYNLENNTSHAFYKVSTTNLLPLSPLIGTYHGGFSSTGKLDYNKSIRIRGLSSTYGGMTDFLYTRDMLIIDLENVSLTKIIDIFDYPPMLEAQVNGHINYHYPSQKLSIDTRLKRAKFLDSHLVQTVFQTSGVNMLKEAFNQNTLRATYQHKVLTGDLILKNPKGHVYLRSIRMDKNNNTLSGLFDLKLQGQEFSGKVYGDTKHPKIDLDMQKLMRYQMDKQLDSVIGKENRKLMEAIPMGGVAKDMASEVGGGFLDMFF